MTDTNNLSQFSVSDKVINDVISKNSLFIDINGTVSICQTKCGQEILNCNGNDIQFNTMTNYGKMLSLNPIKNNKCSVKLSLDSRNEIVDENGSASYTFEKTFITLPSMHKLNQKSFDMEIYSIFSSKQRSGENLYVCLCTLVNGVDNLDTSNEKYIQFKLLNELFTNNKIPEKGITSDVNGKLSQVDLNHLIPPKGKKSFYQYNHPDNIAVNFRIFDNPLNILNSVIANLKKSLFNEKTFEYNNFVNSLKNNLNPKKGLYFFYTNDLSETYKNYAINNKEEFKQSEDSKKSEDTKTDSNNKKSFEKLDISDKTDPDPDPTKLNEKFDDESDKEQLRKSNKAMQDSMDSTNKKYNEGIIANSTFATKPFVANTYLIISLACLIIFNYITYILSFYYYNNFSFEWNKFDDFRSMTTDEIQLFLLGIGSNPEILKLLHWKILYYLFFLIKIVFVISLIILIGLYINDIGPIKETVTALSFFVLLFSILSVAFLILWSKDRSMLGFDYIVSNKDNLLFTDYFCKKLSLSEKLIFTFTGKLNDMDTSILNQLNEQNGGGEQSVMPGIDDINKINPKPINNSYNPIEGLKSIFGLSNDENKNNVSIWWYFIIFAVVFGMYFVGGIILKVLDNSYKNGDLNIGIFIIFILLITLIHFILPLFKFWNIVVFGNTANKVSQLPFSNIESDFKIAPQIISTAPLNLRSKLQKEYNDLKNKYDELQDDYLFLKDKYQVLKPDEKNLVMEIKKLLNIINNLKENEQFSKKNIILEKLRDHII
jgi:carbonic anhydrase